LIVTEVTDVSVDIDVSHEVITERKADMIKLATRTFAALLVAIGLYIATPGTAHAAGGVTCSVNHIEYDGRLIVNCDNVSYYANISGTNCGNPSLDTIKLWESMAASAMLSGKKIWIWVTDCATKNFSSLRIIN
jgi:hypothetical protein